MSKKNKIEETTEDQKVTSQENKETNVKTAKKAKEDTSKKSAKKQNKKQNKEKRSLAKKVKETTSELKKVSWPSFGKVLKQTGVVIAVVAICTLLLFGIDNLFSLVYNLLTK